MKARRSALLASIAVVSTVTLASCSPGIPVAYLVTRDSVDIAFCDSFTATSLVIDFGKYPPPFMGTLYSIAVQTASGPEAEFGAGKPVSSSIEGWEFSTDSDQIPDDWERIDFSFYGADGEYVGGTHLFDDDVASSDWAWTGGYNMSPPRCELDLP